MQALLCGILYYLAQSTWLMGLGFVTLQPANGEDWREKLEKLL